MNNFEINSDFITYMHILNTSIDGNIKITGKIRQLSISGCRINNLYTTAAYTEIESSLIKSVNILRQDDYSISLTTILNYIGNINIKSNQNISIYHIASHINNLEVFSNATVSIPARKIYDITGSSLTTYISTDSLLYTIIENINVKAVACTNVSSVKINNFNIKINELSGFEKVYIANVLNIESNNPRFFKSVASDPSYTRSYIVNCIVNGNKYTSEEAKQIVTGVYDLELVGKLNPEILKSKIIQRNKVRKLLNAEDNNSNIDYNELKLIRYQMGYYDKIALPEVKTIHPRAFMRVHAKEIVLPDTLTEMILVGNQLPSDLEKITIKNTNIKQIQHTNSQNIIIEYNGNTKRLKDVTIHQDTKALHVKIISKATYDKKYFIIESEDGDKKEVAENQLAWAVINNKIYITNAILKLDGRILAK